MHRAGGGPGAIVKILLGTALAMVFSGTAALAQPVGSFDDYLRGFEQKAVNAGISRDLYRQLTRGLTPDPRMPNLITSQPEFTTPIWDYLDQRVSSGRIARGRSAMQANTALFEQLGARFDVDPYIIGAIWGMESDYGSVLSSTSLIRPLVRSLASVAHQQRGRAEADEAELIAAMRLIQDHHWTNESLVGSWAGAVGHTQIIASGLLAYGTDGDGDGIVNPHTSLADAIASTAVYLKSMGYKTGTDWGFEVNVPNDFDLLLADRETMRPISFFAERGVRRVAGRQFSDMSEPVFLYLPAGADGPKFLMTENYLVLKRYNFSDSYALSVAHLTDRLKGGGAFAQSWPRNTRFPNLAQREAIQQRLTALGYYEGAVDGRIGPVTQRAYQLFQHDRGMRADGFVTYQAYEILQGTRN